MFEDGEVVWFDNTDDGKEVKVTIVKQTDWGYEPMCDCCAREPDRYLIRYEDGTEEKTSDWYLHSL